MTSLRRVGSRAPFIGVIAALLALLLIPGAVFGADWSAPGRVSNVRSSRLDSLHQLAADRGKLHAVHPRIGPNRTDDRVVYQRSSDGGAKWTKELKLFGATDQRRHVVPNLAIAARGKLVAVAWRVNGPAENSLFVRVSRDGGATFGLRDEIVSTRSDNSIGVPALAVGSDVVTVAWTNRANGRIKIRTSRDDGRTFKPARTLGVTKLSIDCKARVTDGLVGLAAAGKSVHVAWSHAPKRHCLASSIRVRTSLDRGVSWSPRRSVTRRRSYGWPELDARGKTVLATVQSPSGGVIVSRSGKNGRNWRDRLLKAPDGHSYSAADVTLLPEKKALITYVDERIKKNRLTSTKIVSRRSPDDGASFKTPKVVAPAAKLLRMAPNIAANDKEATIIFQSGQLDGSPRNILATRLR
jgi:hypothetical protein